MIPSMIPPRVLEDLKVYQMHRDRALRLELEQARRTRFFWFLIGGACGFVWAVLLGMF